MFLRLLRGFLTSCRRSVILIFLSLVTGAAICGSLLTLSLEISAKMSREFRSYGANILVTPTSEASRAAAGTLSARELPRVKSIFWRHNILNMVPYLYGLVTTTAPAGDETAAVLVGTWFNKTLPLPAGTDEWHIGLQSLAQWWQLEGDWPDEHDEYGVVVGAALAASLDLSVGAPLQLRTPSRETELTVRGIFSAGSEADQQIFARLETVQELLGKPDALSRVLVNAVTNPLDELGRKRPDQMTRVEYEKWLCTPYVSSVAKDIEGALSGSSVHPIWRVAEAEGRVFNRLKWLFGFLTVMTFLAATLGVGSTLSATVTERKEEIGLMKALGASSMQVGLIFTYSAALIAVAAAGCAYVLGLFMVQWISHAVFDSSAAATWLLPCSLGIALFAAIAGVLMPLRNLAGIQPVEALERGL